MFVGHYAVSFAIKSREPTIPLWQLFLAVQFVDLLFFGFTFFGIERFNIVPNFTASTHFELVYMPYSHGLAATVGWGLLTFAVYRTRTLGASAAAAVAVALAVVSHWFLDLIVHTPDLPLLGDRSLKVGFGLWNYPVSTYLLEAVLLGIGAWLLTKDKSSKRLRRRIIGLVVVLLMVNAVNIFGPAGTASTTALAVAALGSYLAFAAFAYWAGDR